MISTVQKALDSLVEVFEKTENSLNEWSGTGNLQFPVLLGMVAGKLNWNEDQVRKGDPLVRYFVRIHPEWYVTRGAHGGIMRTADRQKKEALKAAKSSAKDQIKAVIEAKTLAAANTPTVSVKVDDATDSDDSDDISESDVDFSSH